MRSPRLSHFAHAPVAFVILIAASLSVACTSQQRLTSDATPCSTKEVRIVPSEFSRTGSTTAWCAECKGKLYQCASTADRTRTQCQLARAEGVCQ
jgi:hypothetical protein